MYGDAILTGAIAFRKSVAALTGERPNRDIAERLIVRHFTEFLPGFPEEWELLFVENDKTLDAVVTMKKYMGIDS